MNRANEDPVDRDPVNRSADNTTGIDPALLDSVIADTWSTYLDAPVTPVDSATMVTPVDSATAPPGDTDGDRMEARIRISGDVVWEMTLSGSWNAAAEATRRMLGSSGQLAGDGSAETIMDGWGELVNTLAGNLKAALHRGERTLSMPEVVRGHSAPAAPAGNRAVAEFAFEWDGFLTVVRIGNVTSA